ncbi:MAG: undecaprenyl/decaprenyl-phosphate alpha-N-acetylglucosaminyl 1-phosphate transferase [Oscillospiraceae bacterium]|nr:undecaprenyl/decaprenyl-phosphate alpha-N-acetylglucosaminyl 1-phosphate transferase [Oscillospiraceae bacterium]
MPFITYQFTLRVIAALTAALLISLLATPPVKQFAERIGAMDIPKDDRRVHKEPIPRLGGLAIFIGFVLSVVIFAEIDREIRGILLGAVVIVFVGVVDDIIHLKAWQKFSLQIIAALIPAFHGVTINFIGNPNVFAADPYLAFGYLAIPLTVLWIVAITNAVNLIDGLDGLAVGVSTIASLTMLVVALLVTADANVALILAALAGACLGFMPYNLNPAKIFMGDTGALLLGYLLATMSVFGLFKFYAIISFAVPFIALALPIADTAFAFIRRLLKGQNPMAPDRGHLHHRLLDRGFSQKQAVFIIYLISGFLGMIAVIMTASGSVRIVFTLLTFVAIAVTAWVAFRGKALKPNGKCEECGTEVGETKEELEGQTRIGEADEED